MDCNNFEMTLSLRERRRQQTARDIQRATLRLAIRDGMDKVTTEAIAKDAGVSTRTFFNYYANKEAAAVGTPPGFPDAALEALRDGTAPLGEDIKRVLDSNMAALSEDLDLLGMVRQVVSTNIAVRSVLEQFLEQNRARLAACLVARTGDRDLAGALAESAIRCSARAIWLWEHDEARSLSDAIDRAWQTQIAAARVLSQCTG